jgi:hypothetical protein
MIAATPAFLQGTQDLTDVLFDTSDYMLVRPYKDRDNLDKTYELRSEAIPAVKWCS